MWDLLERVHEQLITESSSTVSEGTVPPSSPDPEQHCRQMFINAVSRINTNNPNIGKDEKVKCLANRNSLCINILANYSLHSSKDCACVRACVRACVCV